MTRSYTSNLQTYFLIIQISNHKIKQIICSARRHCIKLCCWTKNLSSPSIAELSTRLHPPLSHRWFSLLGYQKPSLIPSRTWTTVWLHDQLLTREPVPSIRLQSSIRRVYWLFWQFWSTTHWWFNFEYWLHHFTPSSSKSPSTRSQPLGFPFVAEHTQLLEWVFELLCGKVTTRKDILLKFCLSIRASMRSRLVGKFPQNRLIHHKLDRILDRSLPQRLYCQSIFPVLFWGYRHIELRRQLK